MILGLDPSTKTGAVVLSESGKCLYAKEWNPDEGDFIDKGLLQQKKLAHVLKKYKISFCVIEAYAFRNFNAEVAVTIGVLLRVTLKQHGIPYFTCAPNTLKQFVTGKGSGKKDVMRLGTYKHWGFEDDSDNVVDAFGLAKLGFYKFKNQGSAIQKVAINTVFNKKQKKSKK